MFTFSDAGKILLNALYSFINYNTTFKVKRLHQDAKVPQKADSGCAGYDIFSVDQIKLAPGERSLVATGISTEISKEYYLRVAPRSGLAVKGIDIGAGVVDSSYRGEIKVLVINNSGSDYLVEFGSKIAQLVLERCGDAPVQVVDILSETERGYGGFGSTGK
uniref:dUTP diphosphatase n=1 Tax=viral metagenome TaxID=1070528 RepID=A0A6C0AYI2_9ZZZZ